MNDGSAMKYLHPESMLGWEGEWVGFYHLGWTGWHTAHHSVILKAKQKEKKRDRKIGRKEKEKEEEKEELLIWWCFVVCNSFL